MSENIMIFDQILIIYKQLEVIQFNSSKFDEIQRILNRIVLLPHLVYYGNVSVYFMNL